MALVIPAAPVSAARLSVCMRSEMEKSQCILKAILKDIAKTYAQAGDGISNIRRKDSNTYVVSVVQGNRVDLITYVFEAQKTGILTIAKRSVDTAAIAPAQR